MLFIDFPKEIFVLIIEYVDETCDKCLYEVCSRCSHPKCSSYCAKPCKKSRKVIKYKCSCGCSNICDKTQHLNLIAYISQTFTCGQIKNKLPHYIHFLLNADVWIYCKPHVDIRCNLADVIYEDEEDESEDRRKKGLKVIKAMIENGYDFTTRTSSYIPDICKRDDLDTFKWFVEKDIKYLTNDTTYGLHNTPLLDVMMMVQNIRFVKYIYSMGGKAKTPFNSSFNRKNTEYINAFLTEIAPENGLKIRFSYFANNYDYYYRDSTVFKIHERKMMLKHNLLTMDFKDFSYIKEADIKIALKLFEDENYTPIYVDSSGKFKTLTELANSGNSVSLLQLLKYIDKQEKSEKSIRSIFAIAYNSNEYQILDVLLRNHAPVHIDTKCTFEMFTFIYPKLPPIEKKITNTNGQYYSSDRVNYLMDCGVTWSAYNMPQSLELLKFFINLGAVVTFDCLVYAAHHKKDDIVEYILDNGYFSAPFTEQLPNTSNTQIKYLTKYTSPNMTKKVLDMGGYFPEKLRDKDEFQNHMHQMVLYNRSKPSHYTINI